MIYIRAAGHPTLISYADIRGACQRDSFSKPETDESHLVRDQDCMVDGVDSQPRVTIWFCVAVAESSNNKQNVKSKKPGPLFPNRLIQLRQVSYDEAHFWLNGYVNKQNCRIWSEANPQVYVETPLHPEKLTVWCALWAGGILLQKR
ncbi:hypothetical protein TNCV_2652421 [Trichonephila clavipes]|nr:hypothetical protein TNCV_2652421 [Trichonephila clavipes]